MKKIHGAPKKDLEFVKYWKLFLPEVIERDNFRPSHLQQLEVLCDLYLDYHKLTKFIQENGYSFMTGGRYGESSRPHVEVQTRVKVISEIRSYTKLLGLTLDKGAGYSEEEEDEWE